jgi:hypothetical protein
MSRGPGALQVKVMETLKTYHDLGTCLEWRWSAGGSWMRKFASPEHVARYERGGYVPMAILIRDLEVAKPLVSRAVKGLYGMGHVIVYGANLDLTCDKFRIGPNTKFVALTCDGKKWLSDNKVKLTKLSLNSDSG